MVKYIATDTEKRRIKAELTTLGLRHAGITRGITLEAAYRYVIEQIDVAGLSPAQILDVTEAVADAIYGQR